MRVGWLCACALAMACSSSDVPNPPGSTGSGGGPGGGSGGSGGGSTGSGGSGGGMPMPDDPLSHRVVDYNLALRTAAIKLTGTLPTLDQIKAVENATDKATVYAQTVDTYLADKRFSTQMVSFWRDALRTGGSAAMDTAPVFVAQVVTSDRPFTDLFTATTGTCPTYNATTGAFTAANCANNAPQVAGVLSNPGVMQLWYANLAFRRVRWVQESFVCRKFPAEFAATPVPKGAGEYTSPWPFTSVPDLTTGRINFQDSSAVVCANCHTTMNHVAPLFANFDAMGMWQNTIQVKVPVMGLPAAQMSDWLVTGEVTSWRHGEPVADLTALGNAMAQDPDVAECAVARVYNWGMSKTDIVNDLATVPDSIVQPLTQAFISGGYKLKGTIRQVFTSDDFVRF
jgi:hypothetical protein